MRAWLVFALAPVVGCASPPQPAAPLPAKPAAVAAVAPIARPVHPTVAATERAELEAALGFESSQPDGHPQRWKIRPDGAGAVDATIVHGGHGAFRIERSATAANGFSTIVDHVPIDFSGSVVELRGFLRTEDVQGDTRLWLREDDEASAPVQFANLQGANARGTTEWTAYSVRLPLDAKARTLVWGVLLEGEGRAWADDLELLVDGKPIWEAPYLERPTTVLDRDHQFDHGSGIAITRLTPQQIENLTLLGKVWGFLKYHHPKVTAGELHWDYELLRELPHILAASDRASAEAALVQWIDHLGPVAPCGTCAKLDDTDLALSPDLDDRTTLGGELGARLRSIHDARVPDRQFYVALVPGVDNPQFLHEPAYADITLPDAGFQLLALFRLWNIVEYWAPDRALADNWQAVLAEMIPSVVLASTAKDYKLAMMTAIGRIRDGHANLWSSLDVRPPEGECELPIAVRFIGRQPVVVTGDPARALEPGDVIASIDGAPIEDLLARWLPYYAGSNDAARLRDISVTITRGPCDGEATLVVDHRGSHVRRTLPRSTKATPMPPVRDLPGPPFRLLSRDVAYLKLSAVKASDAAHYVEQAAGTKGWIVDIRNYPAEFVVFALGSLLVDRPTPFARFTKGDLSNPGAFHWSDNISLDPRTPHYAGKVVVLVDEVSQSQAEYTTMALRAGHAVVVGSTTAGADGNVSPFALPGGLETMISGLGVFYPDKTPTQRIGIVPDRVVTPTIAGLRAGRDEVLEAGLRAILGPSASTAEIQRIVHAAR
ncbi:MAG TPA: S41 family peptidase [Kofleriaceae bacterium]|nr:S41 family peptidase [Kofleriaceae bacterium]